MCACYCDFQPFLRNHLDAFSGMLSKRIVRFGLLKDLSFFFFFSFFFPEFLSSLKLALSFPFPLGSGFCVLDKKYLGLKF